MLNANEIGNRIRLKIKESGLKQKDIVESSGISKAALSNYLNGNRIPDTEAIYKISKELDISIEWILTGESTIENFNEEEKHIIQAYKNANAGIKEATRKLLDVNKPCSPGKSSESRIG
ncbi:helix-turn-helix transcriptional regulator [Lachnospiraceae bacterium 54-53]